MIGADEHVERIQVVFSSVNTQTKQKPTVGGMPDSGFSSIMENSYQIHYLETKRLCFI